MEKMVPLKWKWEQWKKNRKTKLGIIENIYFLKRRYSYKFILNAY